MSREPKYGPGSETQWKAGRTRYPGFYKALLEEPSRTKRREMLFADQQSTRAQSYQYSSLDISGACEYLLPITGTHVNPSKVVHASCIACYRVMRACVVLVCPRRGSKLNSSPIIIAR